MDKLVGMLLAMSESGSLYPGTDSEREDHIWGCSAGAGVGAQIATGMTAKQLEEVIRQMVTKDIIQPHDLVILREAWLREAMDVEPIKRYLECELPPTFADLKMPFSCFATDVIRNKPVILDGHVTQNLRDAVRASMSIWGVFPLVTEIGGYVLCDGGTKNNSALPPNWRDMDEVVMMVCTDARHCKSMADTKGLITILIEGNMSLYAADQIDDAWDELAEACPEMAAISNGSVTERDGWFEGRINGHPIRVLWLEPPMPSGSILKFNHDLIEQARAYTAGILSGNAA